MTPFHFPDLQRGSVGLYGQSLLNGFGRYNLANQGCLSARSWVPLPPIFTVDKIYYPYCNSGHAIADICPLDPLAGGRCYLCEFGYHWRLAR